MRASHVRRRAVRNRVARAVVRALVPIVPREDLVWLGSDYGGWWVPEDLVRGGGTAYCAGVGNDITFDLALIEKYGLEIWAFDPTPSVIESVSGWQTPPSWHFEPVGLWDSAGRIPFFAPPGPGFGSVSATNIHGTRDFVEGPVEPLDLIMLRLGHEQIDLLKMDIEGAEGPVLRSMLHAGILPTVLCVEFDEPEAPWNLATRIKALLGAGYILHRADGWNFTFSRAPLVREQRLTRSRSKTAPARWRPRDRTFRLDVRGRGTGSLRQP